MGAQWDFIASLNGGFTAEGASTEQPSPDESAGERCRGLAVHFRDMGQQRFDELLGLGSDTHALAGI